MMINIENQDDLKEVEKKYQLLEKHVEKLKKREEWLRKFCLSCTLASFIVNAFGYVLAIPVILMLGISILLPILVAAPLFMSVGDKVEKCEQLLKEYKKAIDEYKTKDLALNTNINNPFSEYNYQPSQYTVMNNTKSNTKTIDKMR